jgi:hypothetical protein
VNLRGAAAALLSSTLLFFAGNAAAQDRDFLTPNEIDQVRMAQDPNQRLALYVKLARQRLDLVQQYLAKDKAGRSIFIHNYLEDYTHIIEAIDSASDDALRHKKDIDAGTIAVLNGEKDFLETLNKIQESNPHDMDRFKFVLDEAIDTTSDSQELSKEDSHKRSGDLAREDSKEKKERDAAMPANEVKARKKAADAEQQQEQEQKRKIPSLYKPGEKPADQPPL